MVFIRRRAFWSRSRERSALIGRLDWLPWLVALIGCLDWLPWLEIELCELFLYLFLKPPERCEVKLHVAHKRPWRITVAAIPLYLYSGSHNPEEYEWIRWIVKKTWRMRTWGTPFPTDVIFFGNDVLDPRVVPFQAASLMECTIGGNQASRIEVCVKLSSLLWILAR